MNDKNNNNVFIYTLQHPETNEIRYIGKTKNLKKRLREHLNESTNTYKGCWIKHLKNNNLLPIIEVLDIVPEKEWQFWECFYISLFRGWDFRLTNIGTGGEGGNCTEETKLKISNKLKGKKSRLGCTFTDEQKQNISNGLKGRKLTEEHIRNKSKGCFKEIDVNQLKLEYYKYGSYKPLVKIFNLSESKIYRTLKEHNLLDKKGIKHRRKIICIELNKIFESITDARKEFGSIRFDSALNDINRIAGGYHWRYLDDI